MELSYLRYFYEVAKAGSFSSAAQVLRVSQPSLSKAVALLEAREQVKLLERTKRGVRLTAIGEEVFADCQQIFRLIEKSQLRCRRAQGVCQGPLRLGASDHIANYLLSELLLDFKSEFPLVSPQVLVGSPMESVQRLLKNEIEFALFFTKVDASQIVYEKLKSFPLVTVYSSQMNKNKAQSYIGSILKDYKENPAQKILDQLTEQPVAAFETNSQELQKKLCLAGAGPAAFIRFMVDKEIKEGLLKIWKDQKKVQMNLLLAYKKDHDFSLGAEKFIEKLRK